jgi:hypothetical protein
MLPMLAGLLRMDAVLRISNKMYTFQYFPPSDDPKDVFGGKPPVPPFDGATAQQSSVYYYWWLYLRENADYVVTCENRGSGRCAELYRDFGDVRGDHFGLWWEQRGCELFCENDEDPDRPNVRSLSARYSDLNLRRWEREGDPHEEVIIAINRKTPLSRAMTLIRDILENELPPPLDPSASTALYPVFTKPVLKSLHNLLEVHKLRREHPYMHLHEFGVLAGLYELSGEADTTTKLASASAASRALKQAELLIEYVGKGVFPVTTKAQVPKAELAVVQRRHGMGLSFDAEHRRRVLRRRFQSL